MAKVVGYVTSGAAVEAHSDHGSGVLAEGHHGIAAYGREGQGVHAWSHGPWVGPRDDHSGSSHFNAGVAAFSDHGHGVFGYSANPDSAAVYGKGFFGAGVRGYGSEVGVQGAGRIGVQGDGGDIGVMGEARGPIQRAGDFTNWCFSRGPGKFPALKLGRGTAGHFEGDVEVVGLLTKSGGGFKIDHPIDPAGAYLSHSFVESADMKNLYDGSVRLDRKGEAVVELPQWCEALNEEFRYQLTAIGKPAPDLHVARELRGGRFKIAGGRPGAKVCWQVTGIRRDAWARAHRIPVEEKKNRKERGHYLHPELLGKSPRRSIEWALHPEKMKARQDAEKRRGKGRPRKLVRHRPMR
jgi:hypothetical protein